jgi:hypothetical protein
VSDHPGCLHQLDLCPTCQGLRVTRFDRLDCVTSIRLDTGPFSFSGPGELWIGDVAEECEPGVGEA